ncbi:MAG: ABC transporter ATP-binding protein, partial [Bacilli bacterium]
LISGIIVIVVVIAQYFFISLINIFVEKVMKQLKDDVYQKLNNVPISFIDTHGHGDLLSRSINDIDNIANALISSFQQAFEGIIMIITTLIIMYLYNYVLATVVLILTPLGFLLSYFVAKKSHNLYQKQGKLQGEIGSLTLENVSNIELIKSNNYEEISFNKFKEKNDKLYCVGQKAQFASSWTNPSTRLINNTTYGIVGLIGALLIIGYFNDFWGWEVTLTIGGLTAFLQYSTQFAKPFNEISSCVNEISLGYTSLKRVNEILLSSNDIDDGKKTIDSDIKCISFNKVYFSYDKNMKLIEDFNFTINHGEKIAIVGPTGCGKTTIVNLLLRFYDPNSGTINLNDIESKTISKESLRNHFGMVLQDTWIFNGTIYQNIIYGRDNVDRNEVILASKEANAYDFIMRLPKGFDTIVSDESGLSQGEKQLICIARMMLVKPEIVILDEATSNIDTRSELKIIDGFNKLMKNRTSIIIAHRLSTIINSDKIIVMKNGHIDDIGTHNELLAKKGFYYDLYSSQFEN